MRAKSLSRPVFGLYVVKTLLVIALFAVLLASLLNVEHGTSSTHSVSDLVIGVESAERSAIDLQDGFRGYVITRKPQLLAPYVQASAALPGQLHELSAEVIIPAERADLQQIDNEVGAFISTVAQPVIDAPGHLGASRLMGLTSLGNDLIGAVRRHFDALSSSVMSERSRERATLSGQVDRVLVVAAVGLIIVLVLDFGILGFVLEGILGPIRGVAQAAARFATGDLSVRVRSRGRGEVEMLGTSFNELAEATEARTLELASARERLAHAVAVAEEASSLKSNFVANMSHEIRTPLNGLVGMLTLLSEMRLDEEARKYVDIAIGSSDALLAVVNDVLDIAKIEAGRLELELLDFDLVDSVEVVCDLMAAAARAKGLELQSYIHEEVPRRVRGDRTRVGQILQNLVSNAVKFTPEGEVVVEVSVLSIGPEEIRVRFDVRDTGIGIEPMRVARLFEPFTQAELGTTRQYGGTGLGLSISRELTQLMGGSISGESSPGHGSTFSIEIPFAAAPAAPVEPVSAETLAGQRVLVVDDNATNRQVFESYVASWGMRGMSAARGEQALSVLHDAGTAGDPFRVVLLDLDLAGESGLDLAREIAAAEDLADVRIILLTSSVAWGSQDPSLRIARRLSKPVRKGRLLSAITAAMSGGEQTRPPERRGVSSSVEARALARGARILVAEDHEVNWMLIERMLSLRGHQVIHARDGDEVMELVLSENFDLVLMDCQMPVRDGYDTARELRRLERVAADGRHLPVVAMTATAMPDTRERCLAAGMDDYVAKPVSSEQLDGLLGRWLTGRDAGNGGSSAAEELDPERIAELTRLFQGDALLGVLREMEEEVNRDLGDLKSAMEERDQAKVAAAAHRIRNTGRLIGAQGLVDAVARLDHPPRDGQPAVPVDDDAYAELQQRWDGAQTALAALLGALEDGRPA